MRVKKADVRALRRTSLTEIAVLEMTNDGKDVRKSQSAMVTSKESYVWAALMAHIAEKRPEVTPEQFVAAMIGPQNSQGLKTYYQNFPLSGTEGQPPYESTPDVVGSTIRSLGLKADSSGMVESASTAYKSLVKRGWIEDPVEILVGGALMSVMGLVPVSFTVKTKDGRKISKKIKALYWNYEKSESRGITTTKVEVRLLKMIRAFKASIGKFKEVMLDAGDEG